MLHNAYLLAKIGADTAENEQHFAGIVPIGRRVADHGPAASGTRRPVVPALAAHDRAHGPRVPRFAESEAPPTPPAERGAGREGPREN